MGSVKKVLPHDTHGSIQSDVNCSQTGVQEIDFSLKGFLELSFENEYNDCT